MSGALELGINVNMETNSATKQWDVKQPKRNWMMGCFLGRCRRYNHWLCKVSVILYIVEWCVYSVMLVSKMIFQLFMYICLCSEHMWLIFAWLFFSWVWSNKKVSVIYDIYCFGKKLPFFKRISHNSLCGTVYVTWNERNTLQMYRNLSYRMSLFHLKSIYCACHWVQIKIV